MIFPWQTSVWESLWQAAQHQRLSHALLLTGQAGIGKTAFALHFVKALLCPNALNHPEPCTVCHLVETKAHPNLRLLSPTDHYPPTIKIEAIREALEFVQHSSLASGYRFLLIHDAHTLNRNAANALLKTLEEPASQAIILLITDQWGRLPATILSRCQRYVFPVPTWSQSLAWLRQALPDDQATLHLEQLLSIANGAPIVARQLAEADGLSLRQSVWDALSELKSNPLAPLEKALRWKDEDLTRLFEFLLSAMMDLLRLQCDPHTPWLANSDMKDRLKALLPAMELKKTIKAIGECHRLRSLLLSGVNLNKQLMLEKLLLTL